MSTSRENLSRSEPSDIVLSMSKTMEKMYGNVDFTQYSESIESHKDKIGSPK